MASDHHPLVPALKVAIAFGLVAGAGVLDARTTATAQGRPPAPWCANLGGRDGGWDCGYYNFEQCMATARGLGGSCAPNPSYISAPKPAPRRARR